MIKVNMINGFLCKLAVFLHLLQRISRLLRGCKRVKLRAFPTFNCSKYHCCLHTFPHWPQKHSRDITLSIEAAVKFCVISRLATTAKRVISRASMLCQSCQARHMPLSEAKWLVMEWSLNRHESCISLRIDGEVDKPNAFFSPAFPAKS